MDNNKFKIQNIKDNRLQKALKIYVMPIVVGISFILIIIFLIFPKITQIFDSLDEISMKNQQYEANLTLLGQLRQINNSATTIINQLNGVNQITTADQTEVVKFRNKITEVVEANGLQIFSQQLTETDPTIISNDPTQDITLKEVPFTFRIEGTYNNIVAFFEDLSVLSDFVIIKEMSFSRAEEQSTLDTTTWVLDLVLVKYQFSSSSQLDTLYRSVSPVVQVSQRVLEYIESRTN